MALEAIIQMILTTGINVVPRLIQLFMEWRQLGENPTPEQEAALLARIRIAEDRIDAAFVNRGLNPISD